MSDTTLHKPEMGLSFEKVWAMFQETDLKFQETDRKFRETACRMQETDRKISKLGSRIGDLVEELITPNILEKFNKPGYVLGKAAPNVRYSDSGRQITAEVDLLLENGDVVLAVEVKTNHNLNDVKIRGGDNGKWNGVERGNRRGAAFYLRRLQELES